MSTGELIDAGAYDRITDVPAFIKQLGRSIALSKMFGVDTESQGEILAMEVLARRCPILKLAERYHFIFGKLSMKAEAMLADFRVKLGGDYDVIEQTSEVAEIDLSLNGKKRKFRLTWEEAQKEPFPYEPKEKDVLAAWAQNKKVPLKSKYQTPRARMQMLWARVVSHAVRTMAPEVTTGAYTPEEIEDFDEFQPVPSAQANRRRSGNAQATQNSVVDGTVVTSGAPGTPATTPAAASSSPATQSTTEENLCTTEQVNKIQSLLSILQPTSEELGAMKSRRGIQAWRQLTRDQADELVGKLQMVVDQRNASAPNQMEAAATTQSSAPQTSVKNIDPATEFQVAQAKSIIGEIEQNQPGFTAKVAAKLKESGLSRLADLTVSEIDAFIQQLGVKNIEAFFSASIEGHAKSRPTQQAEAPKAAA